MIQAKDSVETQRSVLLVDDNTTHQYSLGRHLEHFGLTVYHARTGSEALELMTLHRPDVVLLDINLPDMSGFEVCTKLRAASETKAVPVIFHSATYDTQSARGRANDLGAFSFLSYPIDIDHLKVVLNGAFLRAKKAQ
jgi:CheY-like chemotaxis protein